MEKKYQQQPVNLVKVVLFGPESTGKTTLSKKLATYYNTTWVSEYAREFLQNKWNREQKVCEKTDLLPIAEGQMKLENKEAKSANKVLICDTNLLETKVYSEEYYNGFVDPKLNEAALNNFYDLYLLTYIDVPWEADNLRDRPNQRQEIFETFENTLKKYKKPYILIKGSLDMRFKKSVEYIDKLILEKTKLYSSKEEKILEK